ncbi:MAG: glycosyltransferase family 2 protein [Pseudomonadota bacterium]
MDINRHTEETEKINKNKVNFDMHNPLISIVTVVYNGEKYLERCIESVLRQVYKNIEFIVIDGASTDGTLDIIKKYEACISYWKSEPDIGIYDAMNKGSKIASGDYALFLNSDDYLFDENSISQTINLGLKEKELPLLIAGKIALAIDDKLFEDWIYPSSEKQMHNSNPSHPGTLISSEIYKKIPYGVFYKFAGDYDLWEMIRQRNLYKIKNVDNVVSVFRMGGTSNNGKHEFLVSIELEISNYIHFGKFDLKKIITGVIRTKLKNLLIKIIGTNRYYTYIPYGKYRLQKKISTLFNGCLIKK